MKEEAKRIVVTGGSRGIGLATVRMFVALGHQVVAVANDFTGFPERELSGVERIDFDLRNLAGIPQLVRKITNANVLVNNAGIYPSLSFDGYKPQQILDVFTVNALTPAELSMQMVGLAGSNLKRIVMTGSISAHEGGVNGYYAASKAALESTVKSLAIWLKGTDVRVNAVSPGLVKGTEVFESVPEGRRLEMLGNARTGAFTTPEEVAETIVWLALHSPANMTGAIVDINGGAYLR